MENFITLCQDCHDAEYEMRKEYEGMLLDILREQHFLADDIYCITSGFVGITIINSPDYTATLIEFILRNAALMSMANDLYTKFLSEKATERAQKERNGL